MSTRLLLERLGGRSRGSTTRDGFTLPVTRVAWLLGWTSSDVLVSLRGVADVEVHGRRVTFQQSSLVGRAVDRLDRLERYGCGRSEIGEN